MFPTKLASSFMDIWFMFSDNNSTTDPPAEKERVKLLEHNNLFTTYRQQRELYHTIWNFRCCWWTACNCASCLLIVDDFKEQTLEEVVENNVQFYKIIFNFKMISDISISWIFYLIGSDFKSSHMWFIWACCKQLRRVQNAIEEYRNCIIIRLRSWGIVITLKLYYILITLQINTQLLT
jgi:hypothetical protein